MKAKVLGIFFFLIFINLVILGFKIIQLDRGVEKFVDPLAPAQSTKEIPKTNSALPKIAIVLDDVGVKTPLNNVLLAIPYKLNIAIIPGLNDSKTLLKEYLLRPNFEMLLHMPMDKVSHSDNQESREYAYTGKYPYIITTAQHKNQMIKTLDKAFSSVDGYGALKGINNHYGSSVTASANMMLVISKWAKSHGMYVLDSLSTPHSIAYEVAKKRKIKAIYNEIFLDNINSEEYILGQLSKAQRLAERNGHVVAIANANSELTLKVLITEMPRIISENFEFVFVSELIE